MLRTSNAKTSENKLISKLKKLEKSGSHIGSKWNKTNVLNANRILNRYIPVTGKLTYTALKNMLDQFGMVYLKPVKGTYGNGVMRAEKRSDGREISYHYQSGTVRKQFKLFTAFYHSILQRKVKRNYLVQQGIDLLKYKKRLFDIRIMVQKNSKGVWKSTGIIGRAANPNKIVTNYHSGGTPMDIKIILGPYLTDEQITVCQRNLEKFGEYIAFVMNRNYPMLNMVGVDVGIDHHLHPWIIEVNTNPDPYIFKKLGNKAIFKKVYRYAKRLKRA